MRCWRKICLRVARLAVVLMAVVVVGSGLAQPVPLAEHRWQEVGYGVSLRPPRGAERVELPAEGALAAWRFGGDASLRVRLVVSEVAIDGLEKIAAQTWVGSLVGLTQAMPTMVDAKTRRIAERPGVVQYAELQGQPSLLVPRERRAELAGTRFFYGQAAMKLDPYVVAVFEVYAPQEEKERARAVLDAVVGSVEVLPPPALYAMRKAQIQAGAAWLKTLDRERVLSQLPRQRWFRIVLDQEDVGYERWMLLRKPEEVTLLDFALKDPGAAVGVQTTILRDDLRIDFAREAYASTDGRLETWSLVSTAQSRVAGRSDVFAPEARKVSWSETGLRDGRDVTVVASIPPDLDTADWVTRSERYRGKPNAHAVIERRPQRLWEIPETLPYSQIDGADALPPMSIYLSQLDLLTVLGALPHDGLQTLAFYAYDSDTSSLSLRTCEVVPMAGGRFRVVERPTPGSPPTVYTFTDSGALVEIVRPGGLRYLASTAADMRRIWPEAAR